MGAVTGGIAAEKGKEPSAAAPSGLRPRQRRVLQALAWSTGLTRSALAEQLDLPKATLAGLVGSLVDAGLVVERPVASSVGPGRAGRPPRLVCLAGPVAAVGAVAFSGGVLSGAVVSYAGEVLSRATVALGHQEVDASIVAAGLEVLQQARSAPGAAAAQVQATVFGVPLPLPWVVGELERELDRCGVSAMVENDANLGALGEASFGAGRGMDTFLYLKLARGVGAGLVVGGRLHRGATGYAGELSHVHVRDDGPLCACGGRGCLHGILGDALVSAVQPAYERTLSFRDVLDLAAVGEPGPQRVLVDTGRAVGRPLADFVTLLNPEAIIVDGSFAPAVGYLMEGIQEALERYAAPLTVKALSLVPGSLGEDAEILGAAALARLVVP